MTYNDGYRIDASDEETRVANAAIDADDGEEKQKQSTRLIDLVKHSGVEFFQTPEREMFATIRVDNHLETCSLRDRAFKLWLGRLYYKDQAQAISNNAMQEALGIFESMALYDGETNQVFLRLAHVEGRTYVDICDDRWRVIEIDSNGWRILNESPVKFRRPKGMLSLAEPVAGGNISDLRKFVNAPDDDDWTLLQAFLAGVWSPNPPYPVYNVTGEQGSAKSTRARVIRRLTDPSASPIGRAPKEDRDFAIAANSEWVVSFDNVSRLSLAHSDNLARLATGGGFRTRTLYTDTDQTILDAARPVLINGIADSITQDDLADRAITISMRRIPPSERESEADFWARFKKVEAKIIGALCDAVSRGLKMLPTTMLDESPRMADFARWIVAYSGKLDFSAEQFLRAYSSNRNASHEATLEASPIGPVLVVALEGGELLGTPGEILGDLENHFGDKTRRPKDWPTNGRALMNDLKRIAPSLREKGIAVEKLDNRRTSKGVPYRVGPERKVSDSSVTSVTTPTFELNNSDSTAETAQSPSVTSITPQSLENGLSPDESDSSDSSDSTIRLLSGGAQTLIPAESKGEARESARDYQQFGH
jgi:hypothetical protein